MKKLIIFILLLNLAVVSAVDRATLESGNSFLMEDKNVSLVRTDSKHEAAIFCVNGEKGIVREDETRRVNGVYIELMDVKENIARVELTYECSRNCVCDSGCNNDLCFKADTGEDLNGDNGDAGTDEEIGDSSDGLADNYDETVVDIEEKGVRGIVLAALIVAVLILGVIVLWKRT